ncbi:cytochrome P450 [Thozetella sp. PMI_491]|nr:cytochrome P450 [Thozetella sp. PMI_491]
MALLLGLAAALITATRVLLYSSSSKITGIGYGPVPVDFIGRWCGAIAFLLYPVECMSAGYSDHKGTCFRISTLDSEVVMVPDRAKVVEYLDAPEDVIDACKGQDDITQMKYTFGELASSTLTATLVRTKLTQHIGRSIPAMREEIRASLDREIGAPDNWVEVSIVDVLTKTIAKVSGNNEAHLQSTIAFTWDVLISSAVIRLFPEFIKPWILRLTPVYKRRKHMEEILGPYVRRSMDASRRGEVLNDDMMRWLIQDSPSHLAVFQGVISGILMTLSSIVYQLASEHEKYMEPLREEIAHIFGSNGENDITKQALGQLKMMDSFFLEAARYFPMAFYSLNRFVAKPFRFSDGTEVPPGVMIAATHYSLTRDPEIYNEPDTFDGFRFLNQRPKNQRYMINTSVEHSFFGHGRHAW